MTAPVDRRIVEQYYAACTRRDPDRIVEFFHDDATWVYSGPPSILPYCGRRAGKAAIREAYRAMFNFLTLVEFKPQLQAIDGDVSATLIDFHGRDPRSGRVVTSRFAHFIRWKDGKIAEFRGLLDSLDAVEQVLGHELVPAEV